MLSISLILFLSIPVHYNVRKIEKIILSLFVLLTATVVGQTPGALISTAITSPLNPDGDSWVTSSGSAYTTDDQTESEISWVSILQYEDEPNGDLNVGGSCGTTDIMDDTVTGGDASYVLFDDPNGIDNDSDEVMLYRLRIARDPGNGNFGFSVLIDLDGKFGTEDPDSVEGNPGFEVEIRVVNGGGSKGVHVDDVRGTTSGTNLAIYNKNLYTQRSYALGQLAACSGKPVVFYDFYIPFKLLMKEFGISTSTGVRLIGATSINGATVLGNTASDIAGIDDDNYANSISGQDEAFSDFINNQEPVQAKNISGFGTLPVELLSFEGVQGDGNTTLKWATGMELDNDFFVVEKSIDGVTFFPIGSVVGQGSTSEVTAYDFVDYNTSSDVSYYRLKQVDFDGVYEYSNIIAVTNSSLEVIKIYPNPAASVLNLASNTGNQSIVTITNIQGVVVSVFEFNHNTTIDVSDFSKGWYAVSVSNQSTTYTEKVLVK